MQKTLQELFDGVDDGAEQANPGAFEALFPDVPILHSA
jgi:hypothetical protein